MYYFIVLFVCFLDQLSKFCARNFLARDPGIPVINNVFHLTLVYNTGAAFGLFREHPWLFAAVAVPAMALMMYFLGRGGLSLGRAEKVAVSFMLGGTLGNFIDRMVFGHVIDFIDFRVWPVFNIADSFITVGAVMLGMSIILRRRRGS